MPSFRNFHGIRLPLVAACAAVVIACEPAQEVPGDTEVPESDRYVAEVTALDYAFVAPGQVPSGWVTFRLNNQRAGEIHEISLARLPEDIPFSEYREHGIGGWEAIWERMRSGEIGRDDLDEAMAEHLPEWITRVEYLHARNLLSPGRTSETILHLEPGTYSLECWVKNADGDIHLSHGMIRELTVSQRVLSDPELRADVRITLDDNGIEVESEPGRGMQTIKVNLKDAGDGTPVHGNLHLVRLDEDTELTEVAAWLDWYELERGLRWPAPADFLGGFHTFGSMPSGGRAWFSVDVDQPGRYAWIVEAPPEDGLWKVFEIE